ncbi:MAG: nuclear transport factor 2 family protein, partial [Anaerolineaceae bacterium]
MNNQQALDWMRAYFHRLFVERDVDALDDYLHPDYFDDDIGAEVSDHVQDSKDYLRSWFQRSPGIGVDVLEAMAAGGVISAFLDWYVQEGGDKKIIMKGVAVFVLCDGKILHR